MSAMDALLERSRSPGTFVERRRFSLARDKAIEKMKEFSLRDPRQYVLELIQGAVFAKATYIAVDTHRDRIVVGWVGGRPYRREELENLFDYLFANQSHSEYRHVVQLAIALNALLQRKPKVLRVESGDGTSAGTVRLDLDPSGKGTVGVPEAGLAGTYILAEFGGSWFDRFKGRTVTPEQELVETRCRYTPVPILLNGTAPFGYRSSRSFMASKKAAHFDDGARRGFIDLSKKKEHALSIVVGGVIITDLQIPELSPLPLRGVICDDTLRKTADQSDIVQDAAFRRMLHAVQPHATDTIRRQRKKNYQPPPLPVVVEEPQEAEQAGEAVPQVVELEALPDTIEQLEPRPAITMGGLKRIVAVAEALGDRAAVFWTRPDDVELVTASADPARFPFPVLVLTPGQARTLEQQLEGVTPGRLSTTADADFVQRMLGRDQDRTRVRVPIAAPRGALVLTLHRTGPPPLWSDPAPGGVAARVSGATATTWVGTLDLPLSRLSVAFEAHADLSADDAERFAQMTASPTEPLSSLVLTHIWQLVRALPEGPAAQRLLAEVTAIQGLPHFVADGAGVHLELSFPAAGLDATQALWKRSLCTTRDGRSVSLASFIALQGTDQVVHLKHSDALSQLEALERKLGWGHLATPALSSERLAVAVLGADGWVVASEIPHDAHEQATVWLGACLHTPIPDQEGWQRPEDAPSLAGIGFAVKPSVAGSVDWTAGIACLLAHLRKMRMQDWKPLAADSERARARVRHAILQLADALGPSVLLELPWLQQASGEHVSLRTAMTSPRRAAHPIEGAQVDEPYTFAVTLDALKVIHAALGADALPLRFDDPPMVWWTLQDPDASNWLVRRRVDIAGLQGWLGLRREFDATTGVFVRARGTWTALNGLDAVLPCHGLLWRDDLSLSLDDGSRELLAMTRHELYTDLMEQLQAGAWTGTDQTSAEAYAARFTAERAERLQDEPLSALGAGLEVADDDRLAPLRARLEPIFGREAGGRFFGLTRSDDDPKAPMVTLTADDERGIIGFFVNRDSPLVVRAMAGDEEARQALSVECHKVLEAQFTHVRTHVGHFPRLEAAAFLLVGSSPDTPLLTVQQSPVRVACRLTLNGHHEVVERAVRKPGPARELVLLECARLLQGYFDDRGQAMDLHTVHRRLVASRLT